MHRCDDMQFATLIFALLAIAAEGWAASAFMVLAAIGAYLSGHDGRKKGAGDGV